MYINQLIYFLSIAKSLSFSESAEDLALSESALSKSIKSLEQEFSIKLFDRTSRKVALTEIGQCLYVHADRIVNEYMTMCESIKAYANAPKTNISIAAVPIMTQYGMTGIITNFLNQHLDIDIKMHERDSKFVLKLLEDRSVDLGIMHMQFLQESQVKNFKVFPLITDDLVLVCSRKHALAARTNMKLSEAANETFYLLDNKTLMHDYCLAICNKAGFFPRGRHDDLRSETIKSFVKQGAIVTLMLAKVVDTSKDPDLHIIYLDEAPKLTLSIVTRNEPLSPSCCLFINYATSFFASADNITPEPKI